MTYGYSSQDLDVSDGHSILLHGHGKNYHDFTDGGQNDDVIDYINSGDQ